MWLWYGVIKILIAELISWIAFVVGLLSILGGIRNSDVSLVWCGIFLTLLSVIIMTLTEIMWRVIEVRENQ